ncbi:MAG: LysR substrate-binding domain-containing protein [Pseudomonadota bacterium]
MNGVPFSFALADLFLDVLRHGSFAAAARARDMDPSLISRQIKALEAELGVVLFERNTRRLNVTEAGQRFARRVEPLLQDCRAAAREVQEVVDAPKGRLRVTCSTAFGEHWLIPRLGQFCESHPGIHLDLMLTDAIVDIAAEGVDLAIRHSPPPTGALVARKLMDTHYRLVASPVWLARHGPVAGPDQLADLLCLRLDLQGHKDRWHFQSKESETQAVEITGSITVSTPGGLRASALAGHGPALLAHWLVAEDVAQGRLKALLPDWRVSVGEGQTAAWLVYPSRDYVPAKLRLFMDAMVQQARAERLTPPY